MFLWGLTLLFVPVGDMGAIYLVSALVLGGAFTAMGVGLLRNPTPAKAMKLFGFSITYLTLLFAAMATDQLVRSGV